MSIKISGTDVIDNDQRGIFLKVNPGVYTTAARNALSASAGDVIYNSDDQELQVYTGTEWKSAGGTPPAPSINNVVLSEDVDDAVRFTSKGFTANVTMDPESNPVSQKSIKAVITGSFPVYKESGAISNVSASSNLGTFLSSGDLDTYFGLTFDKCQLRIVICPTTKGTGNGVGYYVFSTSERYRDEGGDGDFIHRADYRLHYTPNLTGTKTLIHDYETIGALNSHNIVTTYPLRLQTLGNISWIETEPQPLTGNSNITRRIIGTSWEDSTGQLINANSQADYYQQTSDGEVLYYCQRSGTTNVLFGFRYFNGALSQWNSRQTTFAAGGTVNRLAIVYDKPSNRLVIISGTSGGTTGRSYSINNNSTEIVSSTLPNRLTLENTQTQSFNQITQITYCGDDGSYLTERNTGGSGPAFYKYNSSTGTFGLISNPDWTDSAFTTPNYPDTPYISGSGNGSIYISTISNETFNGSTFDGPYYEIWRSNNGGGTWSLIRQVEPTGNLPGSIPVPIACGTSNEILLSFKEGTSINTSGIFYPGYHERFRETSQTVTVPSPGNFANNDIVAKKGDQNNIEFVGKVENKSGSTFRITSSGTYTTGDEVINLSDFTQSSTLRHLKLNSSGNITSIEQGDLGFVSVGTTTEIGITFPANFDSGLPPDNIILTGMGLSVTVQAVETTSGAASTFVSNTVFPS